MQRMKSDFRLTAHLENDAQFGGIWSMVRDEYELTKRWVLDIAGQQSLMERNPHIKESIGLRDDIIRPLLVIQHFALGQLANDDESSKWEADVLKRLVRLCSASSMPAGTRSVPGRTKESGTLRCRCFRFR